MSLQVLQKTTCETQENNYNSKQIQPQKANFCGVQEQNIFKGEKCRKTWRDSYQFHKMGLHYHRVLQLLHYHGNQICFRGKIPMQVVS